MKGKEKTQAMSTNLEDLEAFNAFARDQLSTGVDLNMVDLAAQWQFQHDSAAHLTEDIAAIQEAIDGIETGETGRPLRQFDAEFRQRNGIN